MSKMTFNTECGSLLPHMECGSCLLPHMECGSLLPLFVSMSGLLSLKGKEKSESKLSHSKEVKDAVSN